jgi:tetratricopeptide (TPR) repeat protein
MRVKFLEKFKRPSCAWPGGNGCPAFRAATFLFKRNIVLYAALGFLFSLILNPVKVRTHYLNRIKEEGNYILQFAYGRVPLDKAKIKSAVVYYEALTEYLPFPSLAYGNLGFCYFYLNQTEKALTAYKDAIRLDPRMYSFYYDLGFLSMISKDFKTAVPLFRQALDLIPQREEDYLKLLRLNERRELEPILESLSLVMGRAQYDREQLYLYLARVYYQMGEYTKMKEIALEGSRIFPGDPELYYDAGLAYSFLKEYQNALVLLNTAVQIQPDYAEAWYQRGVVFKALGQEAIALLDWKKTGALKNQGWRRPTPVFTEVHFYNDADAFFHAYSAAKRDKEP